MTEPAAAWTTLATCPFLQRLVYILSSEGLVSPSHRDEFLFSRLLELEMKAEKYAAPAASRRAIERVRRITGDALAKSPPLTA